jgi:predicted enzyme related to lactoylglutathione lyase
VREELLTTATGYHGYGPGGNAGRLDSISAVKGLVLILEIVAATLGAMWWSQARRRRPAEPQPEQRTVSVQQARAAAAAPEAKIDNPKDGPMSIPAPDAAALASFYCRVFDWTTGRDRDLLDAGGEFVARLRPDLAVRVEREHLGTVLVEDVDEALARVRSEGGTIDVAPLITTDALLWFAVFCDLAGNRVAIYSPSPNRAAAAGVDIPSLLGAGRWEEAAAAVDQLWPTGAGEDRYGWYIERKADWWERQGDKLHAVYAYERARGLMAQHAAGATSGGEGYARMRDVERLTEKIAALQG